MKLPWAAAFLALATNAAFAAASDTQCLSCHDEKGAPFHGSAHSALGCTGCHTTISGFPHPDPVAKVNCASCHADAGSAMASSVHATAAAQPCAACHGDAHSVLPAKDPKSPVYALNLPNTCGSCHGDKKFVAEHKLPNVMAQYNDSIHGTALTKAGLSVSANCTSCHGSHNILRHTDPNSMVSRANIAGTCGGCHEGLVQQFEAGVHGQLLKAGNASAPTCASCHTAHQIGDIRDKSFQNKTSATCGGCHQEKYGTYRDTFHSQVSDLGYTETAHCWDCHGAHTILPASNPASPVAKANLVKTCGKCHQGANAGFVSYAPHADAHNFKAFPMLHISALFMNFLLISVLGPFAIHTVMWFIRLKAEKTDAKGRHS